MKFRKLLLVAAALLATACGPKEEENTNNSGENTNNAETNNENTNNNNGNNENENTPKPKEYPQIVKDSKWGIDAADACYVSLGTVVPYMEADSFEFTECFDDFGDPAIWFYLYYETSEIAEAKITEYAYVAYEVGQYECVVKPHRFVDETTYSYWDQTVLFADKVFNSKRAVEITALDSIHNGKPCLGLFCITYIPNMDKTSFPTNAVEDILGENNELPTLSTVNDELTYSFTFFMQSGLKCLEIAIVPTSEYYRLEEYYFYELLKADFIIVQYDELEEEFTENRYLGEREIYPEFEDNVYYYALSPEEDYMLSFDFDLYNNVFYIDIMPGKI